MIERARKNVPEGFYEVKDMFDLKEGEYCVNGVVSLRATLHIPRKRYSTLLKTFASFMPNGGALLLAMEPRKKEGIDDDGHDGTALRGHDEADSNTELIESAGFTAILNDIGGSADAKYQIILARS
jgi:hypothetical protein